MIKTFRHKALKRFFEDGETKGIASGQAQKLTDILAALDTAEDVAEVGLFPGWRLHPLQGRSKGVLER